jgi:hypothetical protein
MEKDAVTHLNYAVLLHGMGQHDRAAEHVRRFDVIWRVRSVEMLGRGVSSPSLSVTPHIQIIVW